MHSNLRWAAFALTVAMMAVANPVLAQQGRYSFGLWGDMPYTKNSDAPHIPALLADMNAADLAFSIYTGDIKDGSSPCTDDIYTDAMAMFDRLDRPVIYVPGDNEWTDCHRINNGGHDNLERLAHLRKTMFSRLRSFGKQTLTPDHQGKPGEKYSENVRFSRGGVMIVGLNVPGSNNNRVDSARDCSRKSVRTPAQCAADNAEWAERDRANIAWLRGAFASARAAGDQGLMVVIQANPGFDTPESDNKKPDDDGYTAFLDALAEESRAFDGQVVLVHGDSHYFRIDMPLLEATRKVANLTRVETFGSPNIHWVMVDVDATSRTVFTFRPMIVKANAVTGMTK